MIQSQTRLSLIRESEQYLLTIFSCILKRFLYIGAVYGFKFDKEVVLQDSHKTDFDLFKCYLATAEKISDRRGLANSWILSVNGAVVGLYGYLDHTRSIVATQDREIWQWAIPVAGLLVCLSWMSLLASYATLNQAKFTVLQELETRLTYPLFQRERQIYKSKGRRGLARVESWIPATFMLLYAIILFAALR